MSLVKDVGLKRVGELPEHFRNPEKLALMLISFMDASGKVALSVPKEVNSVLHAAVSIVNNAYGSTALKISNEEIVCHASIDKASMMQRIKDKKYIQTSSHYDVKQTIDEILSCHLENRLVKKQEREEGVTEQVTSVAA